MSCREARSLETLEKCAIFPITLNPEKIHVIGDALAKAPHVLIGDSPKFKVKIFEVLRASIIEFILSYSENQFSERVVKAVNGDWLKKIEKWLQLENIFNLFEKERMKTYYRDSVCVPRKYILSFLQMAHDSRISDSFEFGKSLSRLRNYH